MKSLVVSRRAAMLMVSRQCLVRKRAVSAALRVGQAAQAIGAAVDVQFDGQLHPNLGGIESTGVEVWSKRSESSADDCAQSGAGISSEGVCVCELVSAYLSVSTVPAHQHRLFALLPMLSHRHWLKSLAEESSTVSNRNIHSTW